MKITNPLNTTHEIVFIPREYVDGDVVLVLTNEATKEVLSYELTPTTIDGYMYINFEESLDNKSKHEIKISQGVNIIFRGILFVTDQYNDTQNYKTTKDVFTYE